MTFTVRGSEYTFRGTVSLFPADNLASQYIGGYKALNAALRKCRQCLAVKEDMQSKVHKCIKCHYCTTGFLYICMPSGVRDRQ